MSHFIDSNTPSRLRFVDKEKRRAGIQPSLFAPNSLAWVQKRPGVFYLDRADAIALRDYINAWLEATASP